MWLAGSYGLIADRWQAAVLDDWLRVDNSRWASSRCGLAVPRQNGKNGALEVRELYGMVALGERFLHTAHEVKTARKAFRRLLEFFDAPDRYPELAALVVEVRRTNGQEAITLRNGGSVEFVARSKGSGRGFSVDVLVCDEAQELSEDELAALRPTVSASSNPQVILVGTPPKPGGEAGAVFARMREQGVAGNDARLAWSEWSCPDDLSGVDLSLADIAAVVATNPAFGVRLLEQTIRDERGDMSDDTFARERLGWWEPLARTRGAFDPAVWASLLDADAPRGVRPVFGVAVDAELNSPWSAICVAWVRPDGLPQVMLADYREGTAWVSARVAELRERWAGTVVVDQAARGLLPDAEAPAAGLLAQAHNAFAAAVEGGRLRHGGGEALRVAVEEARWRPMGDTRVLNRKTGKSGRDISPVIAAALAVHSVDQDFDVSESVW